MELAIIVGIWVFIFQRIMFALLWASTKREEREDSITQEIIIKANTGTVNVVQATQEEED